MGRGEEGADRAHAPWLLVAGTLCLVAALAAGYWLVARDRAVYNAFTPAEGRFWSAERYERALGLIRQYVYEHHQLPPGEERDTVDALAERWKDNLRTSLEVLSNSQELKPFFEQLPGYRDVLPLLRRLDRDLDDLVAQARSSTQGLARLRERFDEVDAAVDRLAVTARVADQADLTDALRAWQRGVQMQYLGGSAVILAMWFALLYSRSAARKARRGEQQSRMALEAAQRAGEEAQATLQARTALLAMVSHELRSPVAKVMAATELIDMLSRDPALKAPVADLFDASQAMSQQLADMAAYAQLSSHRATAKGAALDLRSALGAIAAEQRAAAERKGIELKIEVDDAVPARVPLDPLRVGQVATNLIGNAVKYTPSGTVAVRASMAASPAPGLVLTVEDTGVGIEAAELDAVWQPFVRGSRTRGIEGSGLGLAVVKLAVESMGGTVRVRSTAGAGSVFTVELPLAVQGAAASAVSPKEPT